MKMSPAQEFIFYRTYSRWVEELGRRETWDEAVERYFAFFKRKFGDKVPKKVWTKTHEALYNMDVMPSMRAFWTAGPALEWNNLVGYNCSALAFKDLRSVAELFYLLMCGCGVGFSVEKQYIEQMPAVTQYPFETLSFFDIPDSREGWAEALLLGLNTWFTGGDVLFDYTQIRPKGARLKTMGGRASGPEPLIKLLTFTRNAIWQARGRKLTSLEWLDIANMCGDVVHVGGIRRAAEISFSDLDDNLIRDAKTGEFPPHRYMSNNTAVYYGKPSMVDFLKEWHALAASGSGERGIFNLAAAKEASPRREPSDHFRTNPCGEINLRVDTGELCNLSEVVVRARDTMATLTEKVKSAVWFGAMQACLTDFQWVRGSFKEMCEEERLLGVSLTGQMDNPALMSPHRLADLKEVAIRETRKACKALGINMSAAITTGKPSGTVSQLVNSASGCHPRYARWYIRRYRIAATDPLFQMLRDQGVQLTPENGQTPENAMTWVVAFPEKAPAKAITRHDVTAIEQLEWYLQVKENWCEHNQSMTVYVRDDEWFKVGSWVYDHFDQISGVSFLPFEGGDYKQLPYEEITEAQYEQMVKEFPKIDYSKLSLYETEDNTTGAQTLACVGDKCEI